jgi:branched-chain amino acid transport system substrate-binding protein
MDGMYATMTVANPYLDDASPGIRFWAAKYKTKYNEDPAVFSVYGYLVMDSFIAAAQKVGPNLTSDNFVKTMDTMSFTDPLFGSAPSSYTATKRLGSDASRLSQIQDGKWKVVSEYLSSASVAAEAAPAKAPAKK